MLKKLAQHLREYGLTNSEVEICILVYLGHPLEVIAKKRFTSYNSAKSLLSTAYKKLCISCQQDLFVFLNYFLFSEYRLLKYDCGDIYKLFEPTRQLPIGLNNESGT